MTSLRPIILLAVLLFYSIGIGCRKSETNVAGGADGVGEKPADSKPANSKPVIPALEKPVSPNPDKIQWDRNTAADAEIPDGIPVYENATALDGSSTTRLFVFQWETNDPKKSVMDFYRTQLPIAGWEIQTEESYGSFEALKAGKVLDVWIGSETGKPVSILIRLTR